MHDEAGPLEWPESPLLRAVRRVREPALPVLVVAHRGDSQNAPENTLAAFALAAERGAEVVELDVHVTADGDVVVIHDDRLDRTTDGEGEVHRLRTAAVRSVSAGAWFSPRFKGERVPLLDEVLDLCRAARVVPLIEIKSRWRRSQNAGRLVAAALERHAMSERAAIITRDGKRMAEVRLAAPRTPVSPLTFTKFQARGILPDAGVAGVTCYWKSLSLDLVSRLRAAGRFLVPWTVNRGDHMERLLLLGCEAVCTDAPVLLRDRIEDFEFDRARDLLERFQRGGAMADVDLETDPAADAPPPDEVARGAVPLDSSPDLLAE